jgi:hypothetical protein
MALAAARMVRLLVYPYSFDLEIFKQPHELQSHEWRRVDLGNFENLSTGQAILELSRK